MEIYLNIIEFGGGVYGAEAAAQYYYKTKAANLTQRQASELISILPSPLRYKPKNSRRSRTIAARSQKLGVLLSCVK